MDKVLLALPLPCALSTLLFCKFLPCSALNALPVPPSVKLLTIVFCIAVLIHLLPSYTKCKTELTGKCVVKAVVAL